MKHVSAISLNQAMAAAQPAPQRHIDTSSESSRVVNALFRELKAIFPAWRNAWPKPEDESAARQSWIKAFAAANLRNLEQIRYGVEQCRLSASPFMPSVGEFIDWCKPTPERLGCPPPEKAFLQACALAHPAAERDSANPAVWHAATEIGLYELANMPTDKIKPVFERAYSMTLEALAKGQPLREIPKALPASVTVKASREHVESKLSEIRKMLAGSGSA